MIPYIALQLKAVSNSFAILASYPEIIMPAKAGAVPLLQDSALYVAMILAAFTILFGTRHLDVYKRQGLRRLLGAFGAGTHHLEAAFHQVA